MASRRTKDDASLSIRRAARDSASFHPVRAFDLGGHVRDAVAPSTKRRHPRRARQTGLLKKRPIDGTRARRGCARRHDARAVPGCPCRARDAKVRARRTSHASVGRPARCRTSRRVGFGSASRSGARDEPTVRFQTPAETLFGRFSVRLDVARRTDPRAASLRNRTDTRTSWTRASCRTFATSSSARARAWCCAATGTTMKGSEPARRKRWRPWASSCAAGPTRRGAQTVARGRSCGGWSAKRSV